MIKYNPFDTEVSELSEDNLDALIDKQVSEGWYIEFKNYLIKDGKKLAKSISSFANAEGGWYIMGVESDQKTNIATEINGLNISEERDLVDTLSKLIVGNISPTPVFEIKIIELSSTKSVIVILVLEGQEPPYVTSSGTIHQREHNSNNPIKDRYILEKLYEKSKANKDKIERFCQIDYAETQGQGDEDRAYLELFLFPAPFDRFEFKSFFEPEFSESVFKKFSHGINFSIDVNGETFETGLGLNFNGLYSAFDSLVIRPISDNNLIYKGTTVELFRNGNIKFLLPLYTFNLNQCPPQYESSELIKYLLDSFSPFEEKEVYKLYPYHLDPKSTKKVERRDSKFIRWYQLIDGHELILVTIFIYNIYLEILKENEYPTDMKIGYRGRITNCWRKFVFFDNENYLNSIKKFNIPATPKNTIEIPSFHNGHYLKTEQKEYSFVSIFQNIFEALGIPGNERIDIIGILRTAIINLNEQTTKQPPSES